MNKMTDLLKMAKYLNYFYPVRKIYYEKICKRFYYYHVREIIKHVNSKYKISPYFDLIYVFRQPPFRGLVNTLFKPNEFYFTCKDIAIAANISIHGYCNKEYINNEAIIDFSYYFCSEIKERIKLDKILGEEFASIGKDVKLIIDNIDRNEIDQALSTKKIMFENYFNTFEDRRFNEKITIWHQNENKDWIEWEKEDSIIISINSQKIREGFFLIGFDYSSDKYGSLSIATRDKNYEYFNGETERFEIIWAR